MILTVTTSLSLQVSSMAQTLWGEADHSNKALNGFAEGKLFKVIVTVFTSFF